jgi:hypothetical protein
MGPMSDRRASALFALVSIGLSSSAAGCASALYNCKSDDEKCRAEARRADRLMANIAIDAAAVAFTSAVESSRASSSGNVAAAQAKASPPPAAEEVPAPTDSSPSRPSRPPSSFDRQAAAASLRIALEYAARCAGTSRGPVVAGLSFSPGGSVSVTSLTGEGVADVNVHDCVRSRLQQVRIRPFDDGPHTAKMRFSVEPDLVFDP